MAELEETILPEAVEGEETPETLAAIERGVADADAGRVTPIEEVRKQLLEWTTESSSRTKR